MATVTREALADLLPTRPPGVTAAHLHSAAREIWPSISPAAVLLLLASLARDGQLAITEGDGLFSRYYLTEPS